MIGVDVNVQLPSVAFTEDFQADFLQHYHVVFDQLRHKFLAGEMVWNFADFMTPQGNRVVCRTGPSSCCNAICNVYVQSRHRLYIMLHISSYFVKS